MDLYRSMGYVQIYFGIFITILGLLFIVVLVNDVENLQKINYDDGYMESQARTYGLSENSVEYKLLLDNYLSSKDLEAQTAHYGITMDMFLMILFILFGILFTSEGVAKTRVGKAHELHPIQKLANNLLLAGIIGLATAMFLMIIVA